MNTTLNIMDILILWIQILILVFKTLDSMGPFGLNLLLLKLKTENWKHCSKIIFKCVNNVVGSIFNIFLMYEQYCYSDKQYVNSDGTVRK